MTGRRNEWLIGAKPSASMASRLLNLMVSAKHFLWHNTFGAAFATLTYRARPHILTMTIIQGKSEECAVLLVTDLESLETRLILPLKWSATWQTRLLGLFFLPY
jgi:hypothetical protein